MTDRARWFLLALALVQRVAYRLECEALPFTEAPLFDSAVYLRQAEAIRAGEFGDPTLVAFGPLYGWFLALLGEGWLEAQLALGLATAFLVERIAARHSPTAGAWALALWIAYPLPLFYETKQMSETLGLFLLVASLAVSMRRDANLRALVVGGALFALAILTRANLLFAAPFELAVLALPRPGERVRAALPRAAAFALGLALVLGANGAWNRAWCGRFVPVILVSRTASIASTHGEWTGSLAFFHTEGAPSAWDVVDQARRELARSPSEPPVASARIDPVGWLRSSPSKLARTLSDVETTFDYGFYGERTEMRSLAWQPVSMGTLLLLGALGAVLVARARGWREVIPHLPLVLGVLVVTTLFHPSARYRLPMALPLVVLAAAGLAEIGRLANVRARRAMAVAVGAAVLALGLRHLTRPLASPAMWQVRVAEGEYARGDLGAARARIARALATSRDGDGARARIALLRRARALPPPPP